MTSIRHRLLPAVCLALVSLAPAGLAQDVVAGAPSHFVALDGAKVHYKSLGRGTDALVLVHGWACNMSFLRWQAAAFAGRTRVLLVDLPGHGASDKPVTRYSMDLYARAIEAVMADAGVARAVLAGHSMGTPAVRQFYRRDPARTLGLIAIDGALRNYVSDPAKADAFVATLRGSDYEAAAARMVDGMLPAKMDPGLRDEIRKTMLAAPQHVMVGAMEGMMLDAEVWKPDPIRVPLLCVLAGSSGWPADYEAFVRSLAPDVDYKVVPGVSHFLMLEKPEAVNQAIAEFLSAHRLLGFK